MGHLNGPYSLSTLLLPVQQYGNDEERKQNGQLIAVHIRLKILLLDAIAPRGK